MSDKEVEKGQDSGEASKVSKMLPFKDQLSGANSAIV